ncbi:hypothetical protein PIB30_034971 [Stylosanthes scabra]|uniref:Uncharacterized protein n=1 Tax=Stylosanthes scabra TaxID=79078 RepID=A0ABU6Z9Y8_9FABA|nr:hypothetical protein [Stylosanthes scabra]
MDASQMLAFESYSYCSEQQNHNDRISLTTAHWPWTRRSSSDAILAVPGTAHLARGKKLSYDSGHYPSITSSFRVYHPLLHKQIEYVYSMRAATEFTSRFYDYLKLHWSKFKLLQHLNFI